MAQRSLTARVYQELKRDIIHCEFRPGQAVYEGELAERYNVSKTPIREALSTLRQEGYLQVVPRRGYIISPISVQDVQNILYVRLLLEPAAAELAAQRVTGEQLQELRRLAQSDAAGRNWRPGVNRSFHLALAEASGNAKLAEFIARLLEEVERLYYLGVDLGAEETDHPTYHLALLDALMKGDHHLARDIMTQSVQASRKRILEAFIPSDAGAPPLLLVPAADARTGATSP